jgi:hypothetical protein
MQIEHDRGDGPGVGLAAGRRQEVRQTIEELEPREFKDPVGSWEVTWHPCSHGRAG